MLDPAAQVTLTNGTPIQLIIPFSSLTSQAVGPLLSDFEMSLPNRTFLHIAEKVLQPLPDTLDAVSKWIHLRLQKA